MAKTRSLINALNIVDKWIEDRIRLLSSLLSLEILSYAVMSNHLHIVLRVIPDEAAAWSDKDIARRWLSIYHGPLIANRYINGVVLSPAEQETLLSFVKCTFAFA